MQKQSSSDPIHRRSVEELTKTQGQPLQAKNLMSMKANSLQIFQ
jgi:hypothetical protein